MVDDTCIRTPQWEKVDTFKPDEVITRTNPSWTSVRVGKPQSDTYVTVKDPSKFVSSGLSANIIEWQELVKKHCSINEGEEILSWVEHGVSVSKLFSHFKGNFKGMSFDSDVPPRMYMANYTSCKDHAQFIADTLLERIANGSVRLWGKVGECEIPKVVMPIVVETSKMRMCHDERYINLWVKDLPFSLENLKDVPRIVNKSSKLFSTDEKSGYDHIKICPADQTYFGIIFGGYVMSYTTLPFGFKASPYIYQTTGMVATSEIRSWGISNIQYLDDRMYAINDNSDEIMIVKKVLLLLSRLGYTLNLKKCSLFVKTILLFLGFYVNSDELTLSIPQQKKDSFATLREAILASDTVLLKTLQRFAGKCVSFILMVPGAKLYTRSVNSAISKMTKNSKHVRVTGDLRREVEYWRFLDDWSGCLPWKKESHVTVTIATDASGSGYGVVVLDKGETVSSFRDYWTAERGEFIHIREALAVLRALESLAPRLHNTRTDFLVDNLNVVYAWNNGGAKNSALTSVIKDIFEVTLRDNIDLRMEFVSSCMNPADMPSRELSSQDSMLDSVKWGRVEEKFGPHSVDLMALQSNVMRSLDGNELKYFSRYPTPSTAGVNVFAQDVAKEDNPYVFPPFCMIMPLLQLLKEQRVKCCTVVVPHVLPHPIWWPGLLATTVDKVLLGNENEKGVLWVPTKQGFIKDSIGLKHQLVAYRLSFD